MIDITLIMICDRGFYPVSCMLPADKTEADAAKVHGEMNNHVNRVDDIHGNILWERPKQ